VTWDGFKEGSSGEETKRFFFFERRIGRARNICGRKPQTLF